MTQFDDLRQPGGALAAPLGRRSLLAGTVGLAAATALPRPLYAAAPLHRFTHGEFEVSVVSDGYLVLSTDLLAFDTPAAERQPALAVTAGGATMDFPANLTLLRRGDELMLFDTGSGSQFDPHAGKVEENLRAAGIDPASITAVIFTHGHPDHLWGTAVGEKGLRYPNARYYVAAAEWDFWNDPDLFTKLPKELHPFITGAQLHYKAITERVVRVKPGDDIVTGVRVLATPGHTPGHVSFEVAGGDGLIITGDAVVAPWLFFPHPDWKFGFDGDPDQAIATRKALLDRVATDKTLMLGYHWPWPGLGRAERDGGAYRYVAAT
ncbi:MBL fold metallo-hydrolase [Radicibacter daui]|uniref:MBL fold metallo-hydrolase n=1 Tax=Radicibacter daui TaxID=3064829 RepID=UPI004047014D